MIFLKRTIIKLSTGVVMAVGTHESPDWTSYWRNFEGGQTPSTTQINPEFLDGITESDMVLDLGCGFGRNTRILAERALFVLGVDINASEVALAAARNGEIKNAHYAVMSGTDLALAGRPFDKVILCGVLGGVDLATRHDILSQTSEVLKPRGQIYVGEYAVNRSVEYVREQYKIGFDATGEDGVVVVRDPTQPAYPIKFISKQFEEGELVGLLEEHGLGEATIRPSVIERKPLFGSEDGKTYKNPFLSVWAKKL